MDSNGTEETPIVIEDDDSNVDKPLDPIRHATAGTIERGRNEADVVPVKAEAYFTSIEATSVSTTTEMYAVAGNTMEDPDGVKTERTVEIMEGMLLSQDESIYFGGLSVDV